MKNKIGVFSGTFDPVHKAHIEACLVAKEVCGLEKIYILIEHSPQRKQNVTDFKHRKVMLDLVTFGYPSLLSTDIASKNITTKNSLEFLRKQHHNAEYWYIFGSDILQHIEEWPDLNLLLDNFNLCVVLRENKDRSKVEEFLHELTASHNSSYKVLPAVYSEVSSSIAKDALPKAEKYLDTRVISYIELKNLYESSRASSK